MLLTKSVVPLLTALLLTLPLLPAKADTTAECSQLIGMTNQANREMELLNTNTITDVNQAIQLLNNLAERLDFYSGELRSLPLQDNQLKAFQVRFADLYQSMALSTRDLVQAIQQKSPQKEEKIFQAMDANVAEETKLTTAVNAYCGVK